MVLILSCCRHIWRNVAFENTVDGLLRLTKRGQELWQGGGSFGGRTLLAWARERWRELLSVSVLAVQGLCGVLADRLVWDGKEKVYGSIP